MISDSFPWREELLRVAGRLEKRKAQRRWTERTMFLVERDIMISAYAIRKLKEANKISDRLRDERIRVQRHDLIDRVPDVQNGHRFWQFYDFERATDVELKMTDLCNQIIHSWIWGVAAEDEGGLAGIYVSSDRERRKCVYLVEVDTLIELFRSIGHEDIVEIRMRRDQKGEMQYVGVVGTDTRKHPEGYLMTGEAANPGLEAALREYHQRDEAAR
ncbi:hypothetical protein G3I24_48510 [Micromonospora aurantiaca]|nr:hypothetical protein [Micromonospora aurantiaca]